MKHVGCRFAADFLSSCLRGSDKEFQQPVGLDGVPAVRVLIP